MNNESADLKNVSILLVDDQPANLDVLCELLESAGYRISVATGGATALEIAVRAVPDLILLDVLMPGLDGYEVCRQLKQEAATQDIPVIFITARDLKEDILAGFRAGGVDYIVKPFRDEEVLARVQTHVRLNRLTQEVGMVQKGRF